MISLAELRALGRVAVPSPAMCLFDWFIAESMYQQLVNSFPAGRHTFQKWESSPTQRPQRDPHMLQRVEQVKARL